MEKKLHNRYIINYNLLEVQDLRQAHYQILLIILLKELIKLNVNMNVIINIEERVELNTKRQ